MKKRTIYTLTALILGVCTSCRIPQYIPVESTKTEYRDKIVRDSIIRYDSIYIREKGDTLIFERFRYLYRDKFIRDSVFICDTIRMPYPVEVVKQVKGKKNFNRMAEFSDMVWNAIALVIALLFVLFFFMWFKKI